MATILSIIQTASDEIGIPRPSSVIGSNDNSARRLYAFLLRTSKHLRSKEEWPFLRKEVAITIVSGQDSYALPGDFEAFLNETQWDGTNHWQMLGPLTPEEWQAKKRGVSSQTPRRTFTIKGMASKQFFIMPTPSASEAGQILYYEYISANTFMPVAWNASSSISIGDYRSYNGNMYVATSAGTTGITPPTHTTGTASDGGVSWEYTLTKYSPRSDLDTTVLDPDLFVLGIIWRWKRHKGLDYDDAFSEYLDAVQTQIVNERGTRTISFDGGVVTSPGRWNIPDTGYGL